MRSAPYSAFLREALFGGLMCKEAVACFCYLVVVGGGGRESSRHEKIRQLVAFTKLKLVLCTYSTPSPVIASGVQELSLRLT